MGFLFSRSIGKRSLLKSNSLSLGIKARVSFSSMYMPVLIVSLKTSPQLGFSRNLIILPFLSVMTIPKGSGFSTLVRTMVAMAFLFLWNSTALWRSMSVRTSPLITRVVSTSFHVRMAAATLPAVPRSAPGVM